MADGAEIRRHLIEALKADLVGPFYPADWPGAREEVLELAPSKWYLTGFLAPEMQREPEDPTEDDELGAGNDQDDEEASGQEPEPKVRNQFPASMGLSVLLPPGGSGDSITVTVRFAEYEKVKREDAGPDAARSGRKHLWRRHERSPKRVTLKLDPKAIAEGVMLPDTAGIAVVGKLEQAEAPGLPPGARALSLFVVNRRAVVGDRGPFDAEFIFQVEMEVEYAQGFLARPNRQGEDGDDHDERVAELQFRNQFEYAVGHNVSVEVPGGQGGTVTRVRTTWLPEHEVRRVVTHDESAAVVDMEALAGLADGAAAKAALMPLVTEYGEWLAARARVDVGGGSRNATRDELLRRAGMARDRIRAGIELLAKDPEVFAAFKLANEAMATSARRRSPDRYQGEVKPSWRLFQLAFLLLNLAGIEDEAHADRDEVELIFFPTGGGKTEAYLGVIAFSMLLRRIRGQARDDKGLGVAVLLRYTLRLLTLDQLGRAATLICALEVLRQREPTRLGAVRFAVGLWVGRTATANTLEQVKTLIVEYKNKGDGGASSPFPLSNCPWCGELLGRESLTLAPNPSKPERVVVGCKSFTCEFSANKNPDGLPVIFVDEQIYRELPCFVVATVDKFAMLPWRGETGMLFGRAQAMEGARFYGPMDTVPKGATRLREGLRPPELIVQDELHLISGPLGTMVGLYETAIEYLCRRSVGGKTIKPKVIASTATVRRAREQIQALFGRTHTNLFPPPGVDDSETWFAKVDKESPGRLYMGVAAPGRSMKGILLRTYLDLLTAAEKRYDPSAGAKQPADAYMTLAGYFNSLRELGGMRRLVEDDVCTRATKVDENVPVGHRGAHPLRKPRKTQREPVELTSRERTSRIKEAKDRLGKPHADGEHVDVLLASNMISVGVDIDRLGLMVVAGQPKTTAEYIQASSRVGRQHPGLVVTCFNVRKPRDRSHFERFAAYHASFYRYVEATSLTPFSGRALERGLAGTLVAMTRLDQDKLTPPEAAMLIAQHREVAESAIAALAERAGRAATGEEKERLVAGLRSRGKSLIDAWEAVMERTRRESGSTRGYSPLDRPRLESRLLYQVTEEHLPPAHSDEGRFVAPTSMRDVEATVHWWIERRMALGGRR